MRYGLSQTVVPEAEPITLTEAKSHLRVTFTDEDNDINDMIAAARQRVEEETYRQLLTATWQLKLDNFPSNNGAIVVPRAPLQSVTSIAYLNSAGVSTTLGSSLYRVSATRQPGEIHPAYGQTWPTTYPVVDAITVTFVAGYGDDPEDVPPLLLAAVKLIVGSLYEHREEQMDRQAFELPVGVQRILRTFDLGDELTDYGSGE